MAEKPSNEEDLRIAELRNQAQRQLFGERGMSQQFEAQAEYRQALEARDEERERRLRQQRREQRRREIEAIREQARMFPLEPGERSELERFRESREPMTDEVPSGGYLVTRRIRGAEPLGPLPSERRAAELDEWLETPAHRPFPTTVPRIPTTKEGAIRALSTITGGPARAQMQLAQEQRDAPLEAEIFETIFGSGRGEYGHPEPELERGTETRRGDLGKPPHPTFLREYKNAYNDYSRRVREGTLLPRDVDLLKYEIELDNEQQKLMDAFSRRLRAVMDRPFGFGGPIPRRRSIPAAGMLEAYEGGRPEEFNEFIRALAHVQAEKQAIADQRQVSAATREDIDALSHEVGRAARRAEERRRLRE